MKIEKVNENQIRCTLSRKELADRQIKLSELAYGSEKARSLFRDMIEQANDEFGFEANDIPLMIEAIPLSGENIILQITKVEYPEELDTRFSKFSESEDLDEDEDIEADPVFCEAQGADDVLGFFQKMKEELQEQQTENTQKESTVVSEKQLEIPKDMTKLFEFDHLEQMERLACVLGDYFCGESDVYKNDSKNVFCMLIRKSKHSPEEFNKVCNIISEYGRYKKYTRGAEAFLKEHGRLLIKDQALQVLGSLRQ